MSGNHHGNVRIWCFDIHWISLGPILKYVYVILMLFSRRVLWAIMPLSMSELNIYYKIYRNISFFYTSPESSHNCKISIITLWICEYFMCIYEFVTGITKNNLSAKTKWSKCVTKGAASYHLVSCRKSASFAQIMYTEIHHVTMISLEFMRNLWRIIEKWHMPVDFIVYL